MEKILPKSTPPICRGSTSGRADSRVRTFLYLDEMRNDLLEEERPTDIVDEVLLKVIDAPTKKEKRRDEARE